MKLIIATVRTDCVADIQQALTEPEASVLYVNPVGDAQESVAGQYRGAEFRHPFPRTRIEIVVVNDLLVEETIQTIVRFADASHLDGIGNGSIFVMPLDEWIPLSASRVGQVPVDERRHAPLGVTWQD